MKIASRVLLLAGVVLGLAAFAVAGEGEKGAGEKAKEEKSVTVSGSLMCAKCTLKKEDAKECQTVLQSEGKDYYIVKNELAKEHHVCQGSADAKVTGKVAEKDGKIWLTAEKIEVAEAKP